jgi:hypothetical protein
MTGSEEAKNHLRLFPRAPIRRRYCSPRLVTTVDDLDVILEGLEVLTASQYSRKRGHRSNLILSFGQIPWFI